MPAASAAWFLRPAPTQVRQCAPHSAPSWAWSEAGHLVVEERPEYLSALPASHIWGR
ncbi:hypothetical protein ACWGE1_23300 [Streptomyces sp. NPDC054932]